MKIAMKSDIITAFSIPNEPLIDMFAERSYGNVMVHMVTDKKCFKINIMDLSVKIPEETLQMPSHTVVCDDGFEMVCHDRVMKYDGDYRSVKISQLPKYDEESSRDLYETLDFDGKMASLNKIIADNQI
jgi:hypothetical protein